MTFTGILGACRLRPRWACAALLAAFFVLPPPSEAGAQDDGSLVVMSFNIRYGTASDGENRWENRREAVFGLLGSEDPDLIGVQEALAFQLDEMRAASPVYGIVGVGRTDGRRDGEFAAILFRRDRFQVAASGTFWLSDTPEVVASRSWGNTIPRICTWARFIDRDGRAFWLYNVHLDHQSQPSRERSVGLLLERIAVRPALDEPVIITGDFNAGEDNPAMAPLIGSPGGRPPRFADAFRVRHSDATTVGTFTGFEIGRTSGPKIDYVLVEPDVEVVSAEIVRTVTDGRYPSDHFPVVARVRLPDDSGSRP
jgi:endonuclease/exonuclease/phosphatase family metal-dependent hydrolase